MLLPHLVGKPQSDSKPNFSSIFHLLPYNVRYHILTASTVRSVERLLSHMSRCASPADDLWSDSSLIELDRATKPYEIYYLMHPKGFRCI